MDEKQKDTGLVTPEETLPAEAEPQNPEETLPAKTDEIEETKAAGEDEDEGDAADDDAPVDMVFGLRRRTFHLVVVGYALGIIVVSLFGLAGLYPEDASTMIPGVIGGVCGYALAAYLDKQDAAKEAEGSRESRE